MNTSVNEVAALTRKAAKGAGYSWSMADEFAFASAWLCRNGVEGASIVATHLDQISASGASACRLSSLDSPWQGGEQGLCSVSAGAALSDLATELDGQSADLINLITPALLIPFVAYANQRLAQHKHIACQATLTGDSFQASVAAFENTSWLQAFTVRKAPSDESNASGNMTHWAIQTCAASDLATKACVTHHRVDIPTDTLETLNRYASYTYAPATEASREGAGAGTTDND